MLVDLSKHHGINLADPAVGAMPWTAVRPFIFSLLDDDTRLRRVLTRR